MNYTTRQDVLDFVEDNNVKFVRFAFTDIFGTQKNIAVLASDLPKALDEGVCFDGSAVPGLMHVEESDLVLRPDLATITILPWRPTEGRVMQFFCDIERPDGQPFGGNCRGFLRQISQQFKRMGLVCNVGAECEFYLFETDDRGQPVRVPIDRGGYFDVYPMDAAENLRRDICLTMEQMGLAPQHSHHESGHGQNEIDFHHATPPQDRRQRDDVQADHPGGGGPQRHPCQLPAQAHGGPGRQRPPRQSVPVYGPQEPV